MITQNNADCAKCVVHQLRALLLLAVAGFEGCVDGWKLAAFTESRAQPSAKVLSWQAQRWSKWMYTPPDFAQKKVSNGGGLPRAVSSDKLSTEYHQTRFNSGPQSSLNR